MDTEKISKHVEKLEVSFTKKQADETPENHLLGTVFGHKRVGTCFTHEEVPRAGAIVSRRYQ